MERRKSCQGKRPAQRRDPELPGRGSGTHQTPPQAPCWLPLGWINPQQPRSCLGQGLAPPGPPTSLNMGPAEGDGPRTELLQLAQLKSLLALAVLEADVERGAGQGEPALLGALQVEAPLVEQAADPLEVMAQQLLCMGGDEGLGRGQGGAVSVQPPAPTPAPAPRFPPWRWT